MPPMASHVVARTDRPSAAAPSRYCHLSAGAWAITRSACVKDARIEILDALVLDATWHCAQLFFMVTFRAKSENKEEENG